MQNKATWLSSTPQGYKVRVQFLPFNEAEQKKIQALLLNPDVAIVMATTQGPLTVDLMFTPKTVPVAIPVVLDPQPEAQPAPAQEKTSLKDRINRAFARPDPTEKVQ